jgi:selenocysteine-specific elongation factor
VRVHLGTSERMGKVILFGPAGASLEPGRRAYCQIELAEPFLGLRGDRFILRDETAQRTIAGGTIVWPAAPKHKRTDPSLAARLEAFDRGDGGDRQAWRADQRLSVPLRAGAADEQAHEDVRARWSGHPRARLDGEVQYAIDRTAGARRQSSTDSVWRSSPASPGMDVEEARSMPVATPNRPPWCKSSQRGRSFARSIAALPTTASADWRSSSSSASAPLGERRWRSRLKRLEEPGVHRPAHHPLRWKRRAVVATSTSRRRSWSAARVSSSAVGWGDDRRGFRDRYQTSRKYAIPLLDFFDREGLTVRIGEVRRLKRPRLTETA